MNGICDLQCRRQIVPWGVKLCRLVNGCDDHRVEAEGTSISDQRNAVLEACDRPVDVRYDADYVDPLKKLTTSVRGCQQCKYAGNRHILANTATSLLLHTSAETQQHSEHQQISSCRTSLCEL